MLRAFELVLTAFALLTPLGIFGQGAWIQLERPTTRDLNKLRFLDSLNGWVVGDTGTILKTADGGQSWTTITSPTGSDIVDIEMYSHSRAWILAHEYSPDSTTFGSTLFRTSDGGGDWTQLSHSAEFVLSIAFLDSLIGLAGDMNGKILRTTDGGRLWVEAEIDSGYFMHWPVRHIKFYSPSYGYAMGGQRDLAGTVWVTTNGGLQWTPKSVTSEPIYAIHYFDSLNIICAGGDPDFGAGMARTTNGGATWAYSYLGIWGEVRGLAFRSPSEGWAPLGFAGTYMYTTDSGLTWEWTDTPNNAAVFDIVFTDSVVGYMVGERGTFLKYIHPIVSVREVPAKIPTNIHLYQNYPNPFNPATTVRYELPYQNDVTITIYDVTGGEVRRFHQGAQQAGLHVVEFDARGLASGVYFYRLVARPRGGKYAGYSQTRKMLLLR